VLLDWRVDPKFHCVSFFGHSGASAARLARRVPAGNLAKTAQQKLLSLSSPCHPPARSRKHPPNHTQKQQQYVDVLREQLQALEGAPDAGGGAPGARTPPLPLRPGGGHDGSGRSSSSNVPPPPVPAPSRPPSQDQPPPDVLALYRARVRVISEALRPPDVPAFCVGRASALAGGSATAALLRAHQQQAAATASAAAGATAAGACQAADAGSASAMLQRPAGGLPRRHPLTAAKGAPQPPPPPPPGQQPPPPPQQQQVKLGKEAAARLATQQALQDGLAEELLGMTAELKAGALAMQGALRQRGRLVDEAGDGLDASAAGARAASRRAGEQYRASRATFCQTCLVLACVACVFAGMLVWIKLTSMVGLSGRRRRGWLW